MTAVAAGADHELAAALAERADRLRSAAVVMAPAMLGAARATRYSFNRMLLRRAVTEGWRVVRTRFELDDRGAGEAVYEWRIDDRVFSFVAFTQVLDEAEHTDRVIADRWEISAVLVEGQPDDELLDTLRVEVPLQERGRLDPRVLVLTRGNRSVRFFDYVVDRLAAGLQPEAAVVGDAGYVMRSTAFYGNGKFGMRSFEGFPQNHPLGVPYRAQMAAAFLFRELSFDSVEHCARARGGPTATRLDKSWRQFFGLGNATGLGLVPYAFKHPRVMHAWAAVREIALADVRALAGTAERLDHLRALMTKARIHFAEGTDADCAPFLSPAELVPVVDRIAARLETASSTDRPFDELYRWAERDGCETAELVVSLLIELHEGDDEQIDRFLRVDEYAVEPPPADSAGAVALIDRRFGWMTELDRSDPDAYWWVISTNTEEPRRALRERLEPNGRDVAIDIANRMEDLRARLAAADPESDPAEIVAAEPELRLAWHRLRLSDRSYGEPRDNPCAAGYLPLQVQRFQLAFYGMDNFKPKSTDWLRVTLFQGAPRADQLDDTATDAWMWPALPGGTT